VDNADGNPKMVAYGIVKSPARFASGRTVEQIVLWTEGSCGTLSPGCGGGRTAVCLQQCQYGIRDWPGAGRGHSVAANHDIPVF